MSSILDAQRVTRPLHPGRQKGAFTELMEDVYALTPKQVKLARTFSGQIERCQSVEAVRILLGVSSAWRRTESGVCND